MYVCGLCFCNRFLTDGFIPERQIRRLVDFDNPIELADRLIDAGLWDQAEDGYQVHDYLEHQNSRERIENTRQERAIAGAKGGASKRQANDKQVAKQVLKHFASKTQAEEEKEEELKESDAPAPTSKVRPAHPIPPEFEITDAMRQKASAEGWPDWIDIDKHTQRFVEYWTIGEGAGRPKKNWAQAWATWLRTEVDTAQARGSRKNGASGPTPIRTKTSSGVRGDWPPDGYSLARWPDGTFKKLGRDEHTGLLPWGGQDVMLDDMREQEERSKAKGHRRQRA
jgi:hypothetical protein